MLCLPLSLARQLTIALNVSFIPPQCHPPGSAMWEIHSFPSQKHFYFSFSFATFVRPVLQWLSRISNGKSTLFITAGSFLCSRERSVNLYVQPLIVNVFIYTRAEKNRRKSKANMWEIQAFCLLFASFFSPAGRSRGRRKELQGCRAKISKNKHRKNVINFFAFFLFRGGRKVYANNTNSTS